MNGLDVAAPIVTDLVPSGATTATAIDLMPVNAKVFPNGSSNEPERSRFSAVVAPKVRYDLYHLFACAAPVPSVRVSVSVGNDAVPDATTSVVTASVESSVRVAVIELAIVADSAI